MIVSALALIVSWLSLLLLVIFQHDVWQIVLNQSLHYSKSYFDLPFYSSGLVDLFDFILIFVLKPIAFPNRGLL